MNLGGKVYPVIEIEIDYSGNDFYQEVNIPEKCIVKVAVLRETPEKVKDSYWFEKNGVYENDSYDAHYDYVIPASSRFIGKSAEKAEDKVIFTLDDISRYPDVCDVVRHEDGKVSLYFPNKYIMNAAVSVKDRPAIFPILYVRQELSTAVKYFDDYNETSGVIRFATPTGEEEYYIVEYSHTESEFLRYEIILTPIDPEEAVYLHIGVKYNSELAKYI